MPARLPLLKLPIFILLLALSALLLAAANAYAATPTASGSTLTIESITEGEGEGEGEEDEGEGGEEAGECEAAEEEVEESELTQAEAEEICEEEAEGGKKKSSSGAPAECVLRSAHGQATTSEQGDKLKLTIGYTTYEPAAAMVKIGHLATVHRHLGRSGVLRLVEDLHGRDDPKRLSVQIDIASTKSAGCPFRRLVLFPR